MATDYAAWDNWALSEEPPDPDAMQKPNFNPEAEGFLAALEKDANERKARRAEVRARQYNTPTHPSLA